MEAQRVFVTNPGFDEAMAEVRVMTHKIGTYHTMGTVAVVAFLAFLFMAWFVDHPLLQLLTNATRPH